MKLSAAIVQVPLTFTPVPAAGAEPFDCPPTALGCPTQHVDGFDCRYDGARVCTAGNPQGFLPGDYSNDNCWPGAIYCPPLG
jgi:hypothetical protein